MKMFFVGYHGFQGSMHSSVKKKVTFSQHPVALYSFTLQMSD